MPVFGPDVKEDSGIVAGEFKGLGLYPCSVSLCIYLLLSVCLSHLCSSGCLWSWLPWAPPSILGLAPLILSLSILSFGTETSLLGLSPGISHRRLSLTRSTPSLSSTQGSSSLAWPTVWWQKLPSCPAEIIGHLPHLPPNQSGLVLGSPLSLRWSAAIPLGLTGLSPPLQPSLPPQPTSPLMHMQ